MMKLRMEYRPKGLVRLGSGAYYVLIPRKMLRGREIREIEWEGIDNEIIIRIRLKEEKSGDEE